MGFADAVLPLEAAMAAPGGPPELMTELFSSPYAFGAAVQTEHVCALARRRWQVAHIFIGVVPYPVYFRDVFDAVLDQLRMSDDIVLEGTELPHTASGERCRWHMMDSDLLLEEQADVFRTNGEHVYVVGIQIHYDEAVVAWNGGQLMYPVNALASSARDNGGTWEVLSHLPHIPKVVGNGRNPLPASRQRRPR